MFFLGELCLHLDDFALKGLHLTFSFVELFLLGFDHFTFGLELLLLSLHFFLFPLGVLEVSF